MKRNIDLNGKTILITGGAGFIGYSLILRLLSDFHEVNIINIDSLTDYNPIALKKWRLAAIDQRVSDADNRSTYTFIQSSISDRDSVHRIFIEQNPQIIVNLAAQAGVRYSITNPDVYMEANIMGFYNILEECRSAIEHGIGVEHLVYASSSSVYGGNEKKPFSIDDNVDHPVSLYAATKKTCELLAYTYSKLFEIPSTGLRFFTVYGPAGRTDMAYFSFAEKLRRGDNIEIFNYGNCKRDFTYVDDIVEGLIRVIQGAPEKSTGGDGLPIPPYSLYNIGGGQPENLMDFVHILGEELIAVGVLEESFNIDDHLNLVPMQPGDVPVTYADASELKRDYGFKPSIDLRTGLRKFAEWYFRYYSNKI